MPIKTAVIGAGNIGTFLSAAILNGDGEINSISIIEKNESRLGQIMKFVVGYKIGCDSNIINISSEKLYLAKSLQEIREKFDTT